MHLIDLAASELAASRLKQVSPLCPAASLCSAVLAHWCWRCCERRIQTLRRHSRRSRESFTVSTLHPPFQLAPNFGSRGPGCAGLHTRGTRPAAYKESRLLRLLYDCLGTILFACSAGITLIARFDLCCRRGLLCVAAGSRLQRSQVSIRCEVLGGPVGLAPTRRG